jgi:hypothetical protein
MPLRQSGPVIAGGFLLLAAVGLLDTLLLLPSALAPSSSLADVWATVAMSGDLVPVLVGPVLWGLVCIASAARHLRRRRRLSASRIGAAALVELGVLALLHEGAAFGVNLWLSNHLPPYEGGSTALGSALVVVGAVVLVTGLLVLAARAGRRREGGFPTA